MNHRKAGKPAPNPMEQGETDQLEAPAENQGRLVDPDQPSGREAGFGHVQSGHRLQATRLHVVSLKIEDVAPHGIIVDRPTVRRRKTGHPVRYELSEHARDAVDDYIRSAPRSVGEFSFLADAIRIAA